MKVLIVNKHFSKFLGGSEIQCDILASGLSGLGHDVVYLALGGSDISSSEYDIVPVDPNPDLIVSEVESQSPHVVYFRSNRDIAPKLIERFEKKKIPVIYAVSNRYDLRPKDSFFIYKNKLRAIKNYLLSYRLKRAMTLCDVVTVLNPEYISLHSAKNLVSVPNSMYEDFSEFRWSRPYCLWVANLKEVKRPEIFVRLAKECQDSGVDFIMVGEVSQPYEWISESSNVPDNFYFLGKRSLKEVNGMMKSALFHVHTCHPEGFGNIFIQAWMFAKPSVSFSFDPGLSITRFNAGRVSSNDFGTFVRDALFLINNSEERRKLGRNARKLYDTYHNPKQMVHHLEELMLGVVSEVAVDK